MELLLATQHGSRLYGLSHAESDYDVFAVFGWDKRKFAQRISAKTDLTRVSYDKFMRGSDKGVPQYLEAMFSKVAHVDNIPYVRAGYQVGLTNVTDVYMRTIKSFWMQGMEDDNLKMRRHATRLILNLRSMHECGRFDPTLTIPQQAWCLLHAKRKVMPDPL